MSILIVITLILWSRETALASSLVSNPQGIRVGLRVLKAPPGAILPHGRDAADGNCGHAELRANPGATGSRGIAINIIVNSSKGWVAFGHWTLTVNNSGTDSGGIGPQASPDWRDGYTHYAPRSGVVYGVFLTELTINTWLGYTCDLFRTLRTAARSG
ncbi:hypothetical protein [Thermogemmatispora sp.]|uniref:hypothetical protein n=1 Tax=Thermogemmatispora sp. TaxID=1968838 RepID=UPI001DBD3E85|nr:hypothetical protein [Thermogemmatispora sp.]MBX5451464.1 hypothetical protein [Thermogemmatispora sp.]